MVSPKVPAVSVVKNIVRLSGDPFQVGAGLSSIAMCCDIALVGGLMCEVSELSNIVLGELGHVGMGRPRSC